MDADVAVFGGESLEFYFGDDQLGASGNGDASVLNLPQALAMAGQDGSPERSMMLKLEDGCVVPITVLQGYTTVVNLDGARVDFVNYVARKTLPLSEVSQITDAELDSLRSEAAQLARIGLLSLDSAPVRAFAERPQLLQNADPILGVLVGYAYARAGRRADWAAIVDQLRQPELPILFDMELLSVAPNASTPAKAAPGMPMLTEGWLLLDPLVRTMSSQLTQARQHLLPSLWPTFSASGAKLIQDYLSEA